MSSGQDPGSTSNHQDSREGLVSPTEPIQPTMRQSGTFEGFGNAEQRLYVRSDRLATEIQSDFGTASYWSTFKSGDSKTRRGNIRGVWGGRLARGDRVQFFQMQKTCSIFAILFFCVFALSVTLFSCFDATRFWPE